MSWVKPPKTPNAHNSGLVEASEDLTSLLDSTTGEVRSMSISTIGSVDDNSMSEQKRAMGRVSQKLFHQLNEYKRALAGEKSAAAFFEKQFKGQLIYLDFVPFYSALYEMLSITARSELELYFRTRQFDPYLLHSINQLRSAERVWDEFLREFDERLYDESCVLRNVSHSHRLDAQNVHLVDCERLQPVTLHNCTNPRVGKLTLLMLMRFFGSPYCLEQVNALHERAKEFEAHLCTIAIVCRGSAEGGMRWRKITGINFPVLADEHLEFVRNLQFKQSVYQLCGTDIIHKMTHDMVKDHNLVRLNDTVVEDPLLDFYQMGGIVLLENQEGRLLYIHRSEAVDDLPKVDRLLEKVKAFASKRSMIKPDNSTNADELAPDGTDARRITCGAKMCEIL